MKSPVVLDGKYVYAFSVFYGLAALWGAVAGVNGLSSIGETGGHLYESIWPLIVALSSAVLFAFTFAAGRINNYTDTLVARVEKHFTLGWIAIVSAYPMAVVYQWIIEQDSTKAAPSISTFMYLVFPVARWIYLILRAKKKNVG